MIRLLAASRAALEGLLAIPVLALVRKLNEWDDFSDGRPL
jgi:hypothetical protein